MHRSVRPRWPVAMSSEFLDAAEAIARRVVADAVWHGDRCNWVGVAMDPKEAWQREYRALEPNLYDGTAGIGLFLGQLAALTGDVATRRTAVGALRQAVARAPAHRYPGFHAGCVGIAWAAALTGRLLDHEELRAAASTVPPPISDPCPDVLLGTAGTVLGRLALGDPGLLDEAIEGGEQLLSGAAIGARGWSWADPAHPRRRHLCGVAHGAAGIGWALLELFAVTDDERFRAGAAGAFAYERSRSPEPLAASWCHGEAGIALTRLRASEVIGDEPYALEADAAVGVVRRELEAALAFDIDDLTLCHGAAGWADALLCAEFSELPKALGHTALERYGASGRWPCTPLGGTTPSLFRGLSGIGWFLLRLHTSELPSPLTFPARLTAATPAA
jgi:class II lanthipeptide synthase